MEPWLNGQIDCWVLTVTDWFSLLIDRKDHRNGIHKPKRYRLESMKDVCPKLRKNLKFARRNNKSRKEMLELEAKLREQRAQKK